MELILINKNEDSLDYKITGNADNLKLKTSKSQIWANNYRDKTVAKIKDDGNGVDLTLSGKEFQLDYSEVQQLYLLLRTYMEEQGDRFEDFNIYQTEE